jgi:hypothetical protein
VRRTVVTFAALVILAGTTAHAQVPIGVTTAVMPSPLGIALTVGKWIYDAATKEQVYYIEVAGKGRTAEEARTVAFRIAVEQAVGSIMSSETEVRNGRIVRDEIINYASGYVDRYEITNQVASAVGVRIAMRVWVRKSVLSNRLLNRSERSGEVDGSRASVQLATLNQERATGDRLVQTVLNDFPKRSFDIELKNTELKYGGRQGVLEVPFTVTWNRDYLKSLWTALDATSQRGTNPQGTVAITTGAWFAGFGGTATYDDVGKLQQVVGTMVSNTVLFRQCFKWPELDHIDGYHVRPGRFVTVRPYGNTAIINGGFRLDAIAQISANPGLLATASQINADIVPGSQCPNY